MLHHLNLVVTPGSSETVAEWYEAVLGLHRIDRPDGIRAGVWLTLGDAHELHLSERPGERHPDQHFAVVVPDIALVQAEVEGRGGEWMALSADRAFVRDPVGNLIEVLAHADAAR